MATVEIDARTDGGRLANNYLFVYGLRSALSKTEVNIAAVTKSLRVVIDNDCWHHWCDPNGREIRHNPADFRPFLENPWPAGCGTKVSFLRELLRGTDLADPFEDLIRGRRGAPEGNRNALKVEPETNRDNVTDCFSGPPTIPLSPDVPRLKKRNYQREAPTGNDIGYARRRLSKDRPDLHEKVVKGELTTNAAMVQAGFRLRMLTVPDDPEAAGRVLARHFKGARREALFKAIGKHMD